jgi:NUDIX domain
MRRIGFSVSSRKLFAAWCAGSPVPGTGPFLWLMKHAPPAGFQELPPAGMCVCAYLFVTRRGQILLGKYADDPKWESLAGLDPGRRRTHGKGWTVPASHLKFGEDPREAARRIGEEALQIPGLRYSEPRSEVDFYPSKVVSGEMHYDIWFFVDGTPPKGYELRVPPWYTELAWQDPRALPATAYARGHEDVVARWMASKSKSGSTASTAAR